MTSHSGYIESGDQAISHDSAQWDRTTNGVGDTFASWPDGVLFVLTSATPVDGFHPNGGYSALEGFLEFDTTLSGPVGTATLRLNLISVRNDDPWNLLFAVYDWGSSLDVGDWRTQAQLAGFTPIASVSGDDLDAAFSGPGFIDVVLDPSSINVGGLTRLIVYNSIHATSIPIDGDQTSMLANQVVDGDLTIVASGPGVFSVTANSGSTSGGTSVAIGGIGFTGATAVAFGVTAATSFVVDSDVSITAVSPAHVAGTVDVTVTTPAGTSATGVADNFTFVAPLPTITAVSPHSGPVVGGSSVVITGTGFTGATAIKFGTTNATSFVVNSAVSITAVVPAHTAALVDITVTTPGGTSTTSSADQFTFSTIPYVTIVSPNNGVVSGGTSVAISGFQFTGSTVVLFGTTPAASFIVNSDVSISATSPASTGSVSVRVSAPPGTSAIVPAAAFTFTGTSSSFTPNRWTFFDPTDATSATFENNPDQGAAPASEKNVVVQNTLAPGHKTLLVAIANNVQQVDFSGTILTQSMYDLLVTWFSKPDPIELTDDLGRMWTIMFTKFTPKRVRKPENLWFHTYQASAMIVG